MAGPGNSSTLLSTVSQSEFTDLIEKNFSMVSQLVEPMAQQLYIMEDLADHTGNSRRYDEADTETFASDKPEGTDAAKAAAGIGYNVTMNAVRRAREIDITFEMRRYNKKPQVVSAMTNLATFVPQRADLDLTHRLTFATSTSYTDMDGNTVATTTGDASALCVSNHALAFSSSTYRNRVSGDPVFSQGALEAAELLAETNILSNYGEKRVMRFNTIITSTDPGTVRDVRQVLESTADVDAAQSGVLNTYRGQYNHVKLAYLASTAAGAYDSTKRQWWFLASTGMGTNGWQAYYGVFEAPNLKTPAPGNNGDDVHNDNWTYGTRGSYGIVTLAGRGILGAFPTS